MPREPQDPRTALGRWQAGSPLEGAMPHGAMIMLIQLGCWPSPSRSTGLPTARHLSEIISDHPGSDSTRPEALLTDPQNYKRNPNICCFGPLSSGVISYAAKTN